MDLTHSRIPAAGALAAGVGFCVLAGIHATHGTFDDRLTSTVDYANDGSFTVTLLGIAVAVLALGPRLGASSRTILAATAGPVLVALGVIAALITGESPGWFAAVAVPGNLLWLIGTVALGVRAWRSGRLPRTAAVGLALTVPLGLIGAEVGASVVPGIVWLYLGLQLLPPVSASPAAAPRPAGRAVS